MMLLYAACYCKPTNICDDFISRLNGIIVRGEINFTKKKIKF